MIYTRLIVFKKTVKQLILFTLLLSLSSCLNQSETPKIPGIDGPNLNIIDGKILLSIGLENIELPIGGTVPIPKMKNSSISMSARLGGGSIVQVALDLKDVESDEFRVVPTQTLPDGRPFPFVMNGELPALAFHIPKVFDMTFYASQRAFGFYLPIKMPTDFIYGATLRIKINGKQYGVFQVVGNNSEGEGSGLVVMLTLEEIRNNPDLQSLLKFSKKRRNKNTVF